MSDMKWEHQSDVDMDDEDSIMKEEEDDEDEPSFGEEYDMNSPHLMGPSPSDFFRFDSSHNWSEGIDEKSETMAMMMHMEKSIVHKDFYNDFEDDFDDDDLA
ncbi:hypothetical protein K501DRAFT_334509 [Backusella circina FSU 941]|nr:hypothetical protein K501DRAFT_334509 [Backusella circina FSU 941]